MGKREGHLYFCGQCEGVRAMSWLMDYAYRWE